MKLRTFQARTMAKALEQVKRCLGRAFNQLRRSEDLISSGHPSFGAIPTDRTRLGMVVTLEPYWTANSPTVRQYLPEPALPTVVASARELEHFIDVARGQGDPRILSEIWSSPAL